MQHPSQTVEPPKPEKQPAQTIAGRLAAVARERMQNRKSVLRPTKGGTVILMLSYAVAAMEFGGTPSQVAQRAAIIVLLGIGGSAWCDLRFGLRNLVRVDLLALVALYFLTFFEFLFPQPGFDNLTTTVIAEEGVVLVLLGFLGLTLGRHLVKPSGKGLDFVQNLHFTPNVYFWFLVAAFLIGDFFMLLAVGFNPVTWFNELIDPRFTQVWQRGKYGSWFTLLNELYLLTYVVPPLCGILWAKRRQISMSLVLLGTAITAWQIFIAIAGGTRNVLAVYVAGFIGGFLLNRPKLKVKEIAIMAGAAGLFFFLVSDHMLAFRNMGLRNYIQYEHYKFAQSEDEFVNEEEAGVFDGGFFVDYNLLTIIQLSQVFPTPNPYLGSNLPFVALTKPVPRALWKSKPEDLDIGIEEALGAHGMTLSCTFVGEAYITGGRLMIVLFGAILGAGCAWWNRLGGQGGSIYSMLTYSAGFYVALISMRSVMFTTTAMLPALALIVFAKFVAPHFPWARRVIPGQR